MTIIIVVCVGFLVFMIVLGVIRIRSAHHRVNDNREEDPEMTWDESSLTITVNPLDVSVFVFSLLTLFEPLHSHLNFTLILYSKLSKSTKVSS